MDTQVKNIPDPFKEPEEYKDEIIDMMRKFELIVGELYQAYAKKFPGQAEFWNKISQEESVHAYWLETLNLHSGSKRLYFNDRRFNLAPIKLSIEHVREAITGAGKVIKLIEALAIANDIEQGMIEKKFFEVFEGDSPKFKDTLRKLQKETIEHGARVSAFLSEEREKVFS